MYYNFPWYAAEKLDGVRKSTTSYEAVPRCLDSLLLEVMSREFVAYFYGSVLEGCYIRHNSLACYTKFSNPTSINKSASTQVNIS